MFLYLTLRWALGADAGIATAANPALSTNWGAVKDWDEESWYEQKTQPEAQALYDAITDHANGVMPWIRLHW